jgi:cytochrome oxidase Cu insertion factor (SCO1/SenC/PrrC family)
LTWTPRAKLLALVALFALPIVASTLAYRFASPEPNANYGELLLPPRAASPTVLERPDGGRFRFAELAGKWVLVASDSGRCEAACTDKLALLGQVRLALGRNASRVERVLVLDDAQPANPALAGDAGLVVARTAASDPSPVGERGDRAHVYLVDPHGNVMMRWPAQAERKRMLKDLERLLKASQIG